MSRPIWSGNISFGMVTIPVKLVTAVRDKTVHFHLLSQDGSCKLRQKLYCPETGKEYDFKQTSRGFEVAPSQYVIVDEKEISKLKPESGRRIEIESFVELTDIDPIYFEKPYYLLPGEDGGKAYRLLVEAMKRSRRVGIAKFIMRQKEYLAAIRPDGDTLLLQTMNFADEVVRAKDLPGAPSAGKVNTKELEMAEKFIEALSDEFKPEKFHDDYREKLEKLIEVKSEGGDVSKVAAEEESPEPRVINLMEALQKSLDQAKRGKKSSAATPHGATQRRRKSA